MKVLSMPHAGFKVKDMKKALNFYCDHLGFKHKFTLNRDHIDGKPWIEYLEFGSGQFVELFYSYEPRKEHVDLREYYSIHHIALVVDDIKSAATELRGKGVEVKGEPLLGPDNTWQLWIKDPDGNDIELMEYTKESLQIL